MLSMSKAEMLIHAFMTSRLDYCNALLGGCCARLINKLQKRLITKCDILQLSHIHLLIIFANVLTPQPTEQFCLYCFNTYGGHSNIPQCCTSVNNSSNLHLYIGHMRIHTSVYAHLSVFFILLLLLFIILFIISVFITLIICCLHYVCTFCTGSS